MRKPHSRIPRSLRPAHTLTLGLLLSLWARTSWAETHVSTHITNDTIWTAANSPYIIDSSIQVKPGASLTLQGATVQFAGPLVGLSVFGALDCYDSVLTSVADSGPGEWYGVRYAGGSQPGLIEGCEFRHGGYGSAGHAYGAVKIESGGHVTILDSYFHHNQRSGVTATNATVEVDGSTFSDNQYGVALLNARLIMTNSVVADNVNGLWFNLTDGYPMKPSLVDDNAIIDNSGYGINFGTSRVHDFAHGTRNVIQGNSDGAFEDQIHTFYTWPDADWRGNDFGPTFQCLCPFSQGPLYMSTVSSIDQCITEDEPPEPGPVSTDLWWLPVDKVVYYCRTDKLLTY